MERPGKSTGLPRRLSAPRNDVVISGLVLLLGRLTDACGIGGRFVNRPYEVTVPGRTTRVLLDCRQAESTTVWPPALPGDEVTEDFLFLG